MKPVAYFLGGEQGSGKTTGAQFIANILENNGWSVYTVKFADPLYQLHDHVEKFFSQLTGKPPQKKNGALLQKLGTDIGRELYGKDVWVEAAYTRIINMFEQIDSCFDTEGKEEMRVAFILEDNRFENEIALRKRLDESGFITKSILFEAPLEQRKVRVESFRENTSHASESTLATIRDLFDTVIDTSGDQSKKDDAIRAILAEMGMLNSAETVLEEQVEAFNLLLADWERQTGHGANFEWRYTNDGKKRLKVRDVAPIETLPEDKAAIKMIETKLVLESLDGQ